MDRPPGPRVHARRRRLAERDARPGGERPVLVVWGAGRAHPGRLRRAAPSRVRARPRGPRRLRPRPRRRLPRAVRPRRRAVSRRLSLRRPGAGSSASPSPPRYARRSATEDPHERPEDRRGRQEGTSRRRSSRPLGRFPEAATPNDRYLALALAVRRQVMRRWVATSETYFKNASRTVCYLSAEYLLGRQLDNDAPELGAHGGGRGGVGRAGSGPRGPPRAGGGAGPRQRRSRAPGRLLHGLARHASTCRPSATASATSSASSARSSDDGWQVERPDEWLQRGNPWEFPQPRDRGDGGLRRARDDRQTRRGVRVRWMPAATVRRPCLRHLVPGYRHPHGQHPPALAGARQRRSSTSRSSTPVTTTRAVERKMASENITKVLYPNDEPPQGKRLRLQAAVLLRRLLPAGHSCAGRAERDLRHLPEKVAIQLNDTHPAIAVAELMRLLVDEHGLAWDEAWEITREHLRLHLPHPAPRGAGEVAGGAVRRAPAATPRDRLRDQPALPRRGARRSPGDEARARGCRSIDEGGERRVRMAHLATRREPPRSTAWPRCTPSCCDRRSCATSPSCGRSGSTT